jgi:hypothetical protein
MKKRLTLSARDLLPGDVIVGLDDESPSLVVEREVSDAPEPVVWQTAIVRRKGCGFNELAQGPNCRLFPWDMDRFKVGQRVTVTVAADEDGKDEAPNAPDVPTRVVLKAKFDEVRGEAYVYLDARFAHQEVTVILGKDELPEEVRRWTALKLQAPLLNPVSGGPEVADFIRSRWSEAFK